MLITKFNKMIRNRILWAVFAIIISISFVGVSLDMEGCSQTTQNSVGSISGKPVAFDEIAEAKRFEMRLQSFARLSEPEMEQLADAAWKRLAALDFAEKIGITCTKTEIDSLITSDPRFQINGSFDPDRYQQIVNNELKMTTSTLEKYMFQEIVLNRLMSLAGTMSLTPPYEISHRLERLTDIVETDYAFITNTVNADSISITDKDVEEYFSDHIELFRIPEQINVKYIQIPASTFTPKITVTEQDAKDFYEDNISRYSSRNSDDELVTTPFFDVENDIIAELTKRDSLAAARDFATEIVMDLMPARDGSTTPLDDVLKPRQLNVSTSDFFSMLDPVEGIDAGYDFNRAAFRLVPADPERRVSDPVIGSSNVYVLVAGEKKESRLPAFEEVRDKVTPSAKRSKASNAFDETARNIRAGLLDDIAKGKSFRESLEQKKVKVNTSEPFSVYSDMTNAMDFSELIIPSVLKLEEGETSELIPGPDGYLLVHLNSRNQGDMISAEILKPQLAAAVSQYRSSLIYYELLDHLFNTTVERRDTRPAASDAY